jgi:hypothetical protein
MRTFTSRGSREHPTSHRPLGRVKQISERVKPELHNESDGPSIGVVGRARGNSLAEESSVCWLPIRSSAEAGASETGAAQGSAVNHLTA